MSETNKDRNVGFLGVNIFENEKVAQTLANNAKTINSSISQSSSQSLSSAQHNDEQPSFFSKLKDRFSNKCDCSCDKTNTNTTSNTKKNVNTQKNTNIQKNVNSQKNTQKNTDKASSNNKSCIRLFGSIKKDTGYVLLIVRVGDTNNTIATGGGIGFKGIKEIMDMKKQLSKELNATSINNATSKITNVLSKDKSIVQGKGRRFLDKTKMLKNAYKNKKTIIDAAKHGDPSVIKETIEKTTGVNIDDVSKKLNNVENVSNASNIQSKNKSNVPTNTNTNTNVSVQSNVNSNVKSSEQVVFSLKVLKTQMEAKADVPPPILSILDFLITQKGIQFSNMQTLDEMIEGIMSFFSIEEPQSIFDILQQCGKVFGELKSVDGIKSLCQDKNIITFDNKDEQGIHMNEWDVLMSVYNKLIKLENPYIDVNIFIDILNKIKDVCGNIQNINLRFISNVFVSKLKDFIETQCNNIDKMTIKEMESVKQNFIDMICSKDDKYAELSKFLVIYLNYFLNDVVSNSFNKPSLSSILQEQISLNIEELNKQITTDKNIVLFVKRESIKEFLSKFEDDNIVITI
jgi:hypothetical protein